eukprot:2831229-Amphidinium_carterae.1
MGLPPTDLNARTGLETPPGIKAWASLKIFSDLSKLSGTNVWKLEKAKAKAATAARRGTKRDRDLNPAMLT